jgi:hypothetical protein
MRPGKSAQLELMGAPVHVMAPDSWGFPAFENFSGFESGEPSADRVAKRFNFKPAMNFREAIEFQQPCLKQVSRPHQVRPGIVVKRRGYLNQALEEHFVRVRRLEPHFLPMLVGVVEVGGIERFKSSSIQPIFFVGIHARFWTSRHIYRRLRHHSRRLVWPSARSAGAAVSNGENRAFEFLP